MDKQTTSQMHLIAVLPLLIISHLAISQVVQIPDSWFKYKVLNHTPKIDLNNDSEIQLSEALAVKKLNISFNSRGTGPSNIKDATGLEAFANLDTLIAYFNSISNIDLSHNPKLKFIDLSYCDLTSFNPGPLPFLHTLRLTSNPITTLSLANYPSLVRLDAFTRTLTSLDVSQNPMLEYLDCYMTQITQLDVSKNEKLSTLQCSYTNLTALDISNNKLLTSLSAENLRLSGYFNTSENKKLTKLVISDNNLDSINVDSNNVLTSLNCSSNKLKTLRLTRNNQLLSLSCSNNQLSTLDISKTRLEYGTGKDGLSCTNNPDIKVICVNAAQLVSSSNWTKDASASYSTNCAVITGFENERFSSGKKIVGVYNLSGQLLKEEDIAEGFYFIKYYDGSVLKVFQK